MMRKATAVLMLFAVAGCKGSEGDAKKIAELERRMATVESRISGMNSTPIGSGTEPARAVQLTTAEPFVETRQPVAPSIEVLSVEYNKGETNKTFTKFEWKLTLRNNTPGDATVHATIKFEDAKGFPVEEVDEYRLSIPAMSPATFTGAKLIEAAQVPRVTQAHAVAVIR